MFKPLRHSTQISLWLLSAAALVTVVFSFLVIRSMREHFTEELTERLWVEGELIAAQITISEFNRYSDVTLEKIVQTWSQVGEGRVTIVGQEGNIIAESGVSRALWNSLENHRDRPEIKAALQGQRGSAFRRSETMEMLLLYAAIPLKQNGRVVGAVRLAIPFEQVQEKLIFIHRSVIAAAIVILLLTIFMAVSMARSLGAPLQTLSRFSEQIRDGHYTVKVPVQGSAEHREVAITLNAISGRIHQTLNEIEHEKMRLQAILVSMVEAVIVVDKEGKIVMANPAAARLFGFEIEVARFRHYLEILRHSEIDRLLSKVLLTRATQEQEIRTFMPEEKIFEAYALPLNQKTDFIGVLAVLHDVSRLKSLEKVRQDFVANVSHELKTPLSAIKGYAETLLSGGLSDRENRTDFVQSISNQTDRMISLVNDLLDLAAIESNQRMPRLSATSLKEVAEASLAPLTGLAFQKKLTILNLISESLPLLRMDSEQIKQVFTNLLENAIKYTPSGGSIQIAGQDEGASIAISVSDTGPGIPSGDLPRIFERFYRVDKARTRQEGGTGLGLAIVKHLIEAHGGHVGVESQEGVGSRFYFRLPKTLLVPTESGRNP